jgi:sugar phosphate isomerase/epimerase
MAILTHGSDLTLAPTIGAIVQAAGPSGGTVRGALECLAAAGFRAVQLDATLPGLRPRDLSARARHDLTALLSRRSMVLAGLELFIPRRHYLEPEHVDRAMAATTAAIEFAADLGRVPLSLSLPVSAMSDDARVALAACADGHGVTLAVHAEDDLDALLAWLTRVDLPILGAGIDPCAALASGQGPGQMVQRLGKLLRVARLSDMIGARTPTSRDRPGAEAAGADVAPAAAGVRCAVGKGDLDLTRYRVAVDLAGGRLGPVVLDLRGLADPLTAAGEARSAWERAVFTI